MRDFNYADRLEKSDQRKILENLMVVIMKGVDKLNKTVLTK